MAGLSKDDLQTEGADILGDPNGIFGTAPLDVSKITNVESLNNTFINWSDPSLGVTTANAPIDQNVSRGPSLWDRFVKWLDSIFHFNTNR